MARQRLLERLEVTNVESPLAPHTIGRISGSLARKAPVTVITDFRPCMGTVRERGNPIEHLGQSRMQYLAERGTRVAVSGGRFEELRLDNRVVSDRDAPPFAGTWTDTVPLILEDIRVRTNALPGRPGVLERRSTGPKTDQCHGQRHASESATHGDRAPMTWTETSAALMTARPQPYT
jgi:hypothetical protein